jgi:hypothetical protein
MALSTRSFQALPFSASSFQSFTIITFILLPTPSSHLILGLPVRWLPTGYHSNSLFTIPVWSDTPGTTQTAYSVTTVSPTNINIAIRPISAPRFSCSTPQLYARKQPNSIRKNLAYRTYRHHIPRVWTHHPRTTRALPLWSLHDYYIIVRHITSTVKLARRRSTDFPRIPQTGFILRWIVIW